MTARLYQLTRRHLHDDLTLRLPRTEREATADPMDWGDPAVVNAVLDAPATSSSTRELDTATVRACEAVFYVLVGVAAFAFAVLSWLNKLPNGATP